MGKIILCVGNKLTDDPHVHFVAEKVKALDSEARVVLLDADLDSNHIEINTGRTSKDATSVFVIVDGERIPAESITTVWYAWNPHPPETSNLQGSDISSVFILVLNIRGIRVKRRKGHFSPE